MTGTQVQYGAGPLSPAPSGAASMGGPLTEGPADIGEMKLEDVAQLAIGLAARVAELEDRVAALEDNDSDEGGDDGR